MALTNEELRLLLAELPDGALVFTEGCDCTGSATSVDCTDNEIMIWRSFQGKTSPRLEQEAKQLSQESYERLQRSRQWIEDEKRDAARDMGITVEELERLLP